MGLGRYADGLFKEEPPRHRQQGAGKAALSQEAAGPWGQRGINEAATGGAGDGGLGRQHEIGGGGGED